MAYVYGHYKADTGELFYIGKGSKKRAWSTNGRNAYWTRVANKHGLVVKILEDGLTDEEAFKKEKLLIEEVGLDNLVNATEGGLGLTSTKAKEINNRPDVKKKISEGMKKHLENPENRKKMVDRMRNREYSESWREQQSEYSKHRFDGNEEARKKWIENLSKAAQERAQDASWKDAITARNRKQAADPEYRKRVSEGLKRSWAERKLKSKGVADV